MNAVAAYIAAFVLFYFCVLFVVWAIDFGALKIGGHPRETPQALLLIALVVTFIAAIAQGIAIGILTLAQLS